jgi:pimeloyl-ACP methyl ester carboxylesterase
VFFDTLEERVLFSSVDTSSVALDLADGATHAAINRHEALFVLVHGDNMNAPMMSIMAKAVQDQLPPGQYQVLTLDWSKLAASGNTTKSALAVGGALAKMIENSHIPLSRVNLIGFSMGGTVIDNAADDLKTKTSQVNRLIGIDPRDDASPDFADVSSYSIAFCGNDSYGKTAASLSADDAVLLTGLSTDNLQRHANVFGTVLTMWEDDAGLRGSGDMRVSSLFSIRSILAGSPLPWRQNGVSGGFEAVMPCDVSTSIPYPLSITYMNSHKHKVAIE